MRGYQNVRLVARFMGNWDRSRRQENVKTFKILEALEEVASGSMEWDLTSDRKNFYTRYGSRH